ncbi:MAG: hypothetical protein M5T61_21400 [Acidimicrobiia bacterium]|nr:hypothetical protein [Acidimicrobiia bacterium]
MTQKVGALGAGLTATLTPVAAGIAVLGKQAFDQWDTAIDGIRANTGKTGKELEALGDVVKRVGATSNQPLSQIGDTVAQLESAARSDRAAARNAPPGSSRTCSTSGSTRASRLSPVSSATGR